MWRAGEHERERWFRLLAEAGIPTDPDDLSIEPPAVDPPSIPSGATVIHPGASSGARRWPVSRWVAVARAERAAGRPVVITGDNREVPLARAVAAAAGLDPGCVLAGRTDLLSLLAIIAAAGRLVCGDTGVAHVASATGTPSVVLFGPTSPAEWGPPAGGPHIALWLGRLGDAHADVTDPGLLGISVEAVLTALARLPA